MINADKEKTSFLWYRDFIKRIFDIILSFSALVFFCIPMIIISICIKIDSPKEPILFKQIRVGKNGVPFVIYKFRTMKSEAPHQMSTETFINPQKYITKIGGKLRKSSLDELPQLFNVLIGNMSLIGPRPLIQKEKKVLAWRNQYGAYKVLPGITGLAQVHGRDELTGQLKAKFDGEYAKQVSFILDCKILFKTINDVIHSRGIHEGAR